MSYRTADPAFRERIEAAELEISALTDEISAKTTDLVRSLEDAARLRARIEQEGPGGGARGARLIRIPLLVTTLLGAGVLLLPLQALIANDLHLAPRHGLVLFVMTSGPVTMATAIAGAHRTYLRWAIALSAIVALLLALGCSGRFHVE